jgi:hypothetical protein
VFWLKAPNVPVVHEGVHVEKPICRNKRAQEGCDANNQLHLCTHSTHMGHTGVISRSEEEHSLPEPECIDKSNG